MQAQISNEMEIQAKLIAQVKREIESLRQRELKTTNLVERRKLESRRSELSAVLAEVERRMAQPSRTLYVSPTKPDPLFESYGKAVAQKIEAYGSTHFPKSNGESLYGRVVLILTIKSNGTLEEVEVASRSGIPALDKHAVKVARAVAPFEAFSPEISKVADRLVFVFPFAYRREEEK
jgi:protein TonB